MKRISRNRSLLFRSASMSLLGLALLMHSLSLAFGSTSAFPGQRHHHHVNARHKVIQGGRCRQFASGVIVPEQMPGSFRHLGRGSGFAPVGEAVFRSSNRLSPCPSVHGRRG